MNSKLSNIDIFLDRTSSLLNISKSKVQELFRPNGLKAFRLNGINFYNLNIEEKRIEIEKILDELDTLGVAIKPISFYEYGYSFPAEQTQLLTSSKAFLDGNIFIQNPASWLPVLLMELSPGQNIIDMCSSPGGKAMHVATLFGELPTMVESKQHRFNRLIQSLNESGFSINKDDSKLVNADGKHLTSLLSLDENGNIVLSANSGVADQGNQIADIVMVDAECSNEAGINFLDRGDPLKGWSLKRVEECARLQIQLLTSAYKLTKPGGQIIYSTCTLSPEENEMVVSEVIKRVDAKGGNLEVVPNDIFIDGRLRPVRSWKGNNFSKEVSNNVTRIIPGHNDLFDGFCVTKHVRTI